MSAESSFPRELLVFFIPLIRIVGKNAIRKPHRSFQVPVLLWRKYLFACLHNVRASLRHGAAQCIFGRPGYFSFIFAGVISPGLSPYLPEGLTLSTGDGVAGFAGAVIGAGVFRESAASFFIRKSLTKHHSGQARFFGILRHQTLYSALPQKAGRFGFRRIFHCHVFTFGQQFAASYRF